MTDSLINLSGSNHDIAGWIWSNHVPKRGSVKYLQAEILRAIEALRWEAQENGNINWDEGFESHADLISRSLLAQAELSEQDRIQLVDDIKRIKEFLPPSELTSDSQINSLPYVEDDLYDRLTDQLIAYCRRQPRHILLSQQNINPSR